MNTDKNNRKTWTDAERNERKNRKRTTATLEAEMPKEKPTEEEPVPEVPGGVAEGISFNEGGGWVEVKRKKVYKPKRELTIDEMDAREQELQAAEDHTDKDFNGELFESNRHDHDRV